MNQLILHKYFKGIATQQEEKLIVEWVAASEANKTQYRKERMLYDITLFSETAERKKSGFIRSFAKWSVRIAASILVVLSCALLFREYKFSRLPQQQAITVPVGQRAKIMLADGTAVWLNAKSTLTYSATFGLDNRNVELDGEAYFEVAKNSGMPFYVNTEHNRIKVIGTVFNVSAYQGSNEFETTLVEGVVNIYNRNDGRMLTQLTKDQHFRSDGKNSVKKYLHSYDFLRWKEGLYCFDDTPFRALLDKLEKYYNVKIEVENPDVLDYQCTGKFKENDGVEHILKVIQKDRKFTYSMNENKDYITIK